MEDLQLQFEVEGFEQEKEWRGWSWFPGAGQESGYGMEEKGNFHRLMQRALVPNGMGGIKERKESRRPLRFKEHLETQRGWR